jgi:hypothetical protein
MANSFNLHNRLGADSSSVSMSHLENSALDRKNQLENIILQLKKMVTHLSVVTDNEVRDYDILED